MTPKINHTLLTREQETALLQRAQAGDAAALAELVEHNQRLVCKIAAHYWRADVDFEDLIQAGNVGLLEAIRRFDPARNCRLSTYAFPWIRLRIKRLMGKIAAENDKTCSLDAPNTNPEEDMDWLEALPAHDPGPEEQMIQNDCQRKTLEALDTLPPLWFEIMCLSYGLRGRPKLRTVEIADRVGCPTNTVLQIRNRSTIFLRLS